MYSKSAPLFELKAFFTSLFFALHFFGVGQLSGAEEVNTPVVDWAKKPAPEIVLVGDSTVADATGWGRGFVAFLKPGSVCVNTAQGGRSSKSFRDEGLWAKALGLHGKLYVIQFGHNDQPGKGPLRETDAATTFRENLRRFVHEVRGQGGEVILVTSLTRRNFDPERPACILSTLTPYANATLAVGVEETVPVCDLHRLSIEYCERLGPAGTAAYNFVDSKGKVDTTHLQEQGSRDFARLLIRDLVRLRPELRDAFLPPAFE